MTKKILVITPLYPFEMLGACPQDRAQGILFLKELGYEVSVVTMAYKRHLADVPRAEQTFGVPITPILYTSERDTAVRKTLSHLFKRIRRVVNPENWDGAAFEFKDPFTQETVINKLDEFKPDLVWVDYSYLWPLYPHIRSRNIPIITRSINFEPSHFLHKTSKNIVDRLKYNAKVHSEEKMLRESDLICSITPKEKAIYEQMNDRAHIVNLPLRRLGSFIGTHRVRPKDSSLNVFFIGSNFQVYHMLQALTFILDSINPMLQAQYPGMFKVHIVGSKIPDAILNTQYPQVTFHGFVEDLDTFLEDMDIALSPSFSGDGMQQKIFEPIVRGIPTITSDRGLAGYPFYDGIHLLTAEKDPRSFVSALGALVDHNERGRISANAITLAQALFGEGTVQNIIRWNVEKLMTHAHD